MTTFDIINAIVDSYIKELEAAALAYCFIKVMAGRGAMEDDNENDQV